MIFGSAVIGIPAARLMILVRVVRIVIGIHSSSHLTELIHSEGWDHCCGWHSGWRTDRVAGKVLRIDCRSRTERRRRVRSRVLLRLAGRWGRRVLDEGTACCCLSHDCCWDNGVAHALRRGRGKESVFGIGRQAGGVVTHRRIRGWEWVCRHGHTTGRRGGISGVRDWQQAGRAAGRRDAGDQVCDRLHAGTARRNGSVRNWHRHGDPSHRGVGWRLLLRLLVCILNGRGERGIGWQTRAEHHKRLRSHARPTLDLRIDIVETRRS